MAEQEGEQRGAAWELGRAEQTGPERGRAGQRWVETGQRKRASPRIAGRDGHRGRDVDDRKTKIRNSNLSREQLISRFYLAVSTSNSPPAAAARSRSVLSFGEPIRPVGVLLPTPRMHTDVPTSVSSLRDSCDNWQTDRAFNRRERMVKLE